MRPMWSKLLRDMGNACKGQGGAVTVFLSIIFVSLLIFTGLIVDLARIMVAERKVDNALQSAVRSVLAECDPILAGQFGLYGVDYAGKTEEIKRYLNNNLVERHKGFAFVEYQVEKVEAAALPGQTILNNEIFEQEILQYMRYKAPLRITENVVEKFRKGAVSTKAQAGTVATAAAKQSKVVRRKVVTLNKTLQTKGGAFQRGARTRLNELGSLQDDLTQINGELVSYQQVAEQSGEKLREAAKVTGQDYGQLDVSAEILSLQEKTRILHTNISDNINLLEEIIPLEDELDSLRGVKGEDAAERRSALNSQLQGLATRWQGLNVIELPTIEYAGLNSQDVKTKQQLMQQLKNLYGANLTNREVISAEDFRTANLEIPGSLSEDLNFADPEADLAEMDLSNNLAESAGLALFELADKFAQGLEQALLDGGKKLGLCEYIMDKYTFTTTQTARDHYFELGEVEYILCGHAAELANISDMFVKLFVIRLAIDTLDTFLKSTIWHPAARLAEALASGFARACSDMLYLYQGKAIALCPSYPQPSLAYSDYLRLFLLLQDKNTQLDRMRQLIQVDIRDMNQSFILKQHSTSFKVRSEISVNLLFLPALHLDKLGFPGFSQDRYILVKETMAGY